MMIQIFSHYSGYITLKPVLSPSLFNVNILKTNTYIISYQKNVVSLSGWGGGVQGDPPRAHWLEAL